MAEMEKTLEEYRRLLPAAEKYIYMNSAGCGPLPMPVLERMEGVFRRMALEGQVNVEIHGWLKEMLEEIRAEVAAFINAKPRGDLFCPLHRGRFEHDFPDVRLGAGG